MFDTKIALGVVIVIVTAIVSYVAVVFVLDDLSSNRNPNPQSYLAFPVFLLMPPAFVGWAWQEFLGMDLEELAINAIAGLTGCGGELSELIVWSLAILVWPIVFFIICAYGASKRQEKRKQPTGSASANIQ